MMLLIILYDSKKLLLIILYNSKKLLLIEDNTSDELWEIFNLICIICLRKSEKMHLIDYDFL